MIQTTLNTPFSDNTLALALSFPTSFKRYVDLSVGRGLQFFVHNPDTPCLLNDTNPDVIDFYNNSTNPELWEQLEICATNWKLIKEFSDLSANEIYISFIDYLNGIITQEDIQHMVRAIVLMNTDIEKFQPLFDNAFVISHDMFVNALIKAVVNELTILKSVPGTYKDAEVPSSFTRSIETAFRTGFFNHMQNLINWQNTNFIDCIDKSRHLAIWYFISRTAKGSKVLYDENQNLKNQYGGITCNSIDLFDALAFIKSDEVKQLMSRCHCYNNNFTDFLKEHTPKKDDFIFADLRLANQFSGSSSDLKLKSYNIQLIEVLSKIDAPWMVLTDIPAHDLQAHPAIHFEQTRLNNHELTIVKNYKSRVENS
ncbi:MAG: hypothetical protein AB7S69_06375 [Salinivirgaceae bacterium]